MPLYLPKLRQDLVMRPHQTARDTSVIVKNPATGRFFQLGEAELFIAQQLDGKTPLESIRQRTESHFSAELSLETLGAFLANLKKNGMLEDADSSRQTANSKQRRFRGSPLYCRFKVFDPCELLKRMVPWTGFFYTPFFVIFSAATILTAVGITVGHWAEFRESLPRLYGVSQIVLVIALNFLVITAHEFGHGLTCAHFGGEVHEMGCALVFLQPAFYCNVSDAWLFPKKSQRLWVGFAGPYFELFLWSLAVLTWRVTEPDVWINFVALSVMTTSGLKTLFNFNPLIKLDGYYLLSDYLELPNMRRRSFRYVGSFFERLFGFGEPVTSHETLSLREKIIFSLYGSSALAGSFSIFGLILITAGATLVDGRSPSAVLLMLFLLGMKYRRRFRRMFGNPQGGSASFDDEDFDSYEKNDEENDSKTWITAEKVASAEANGITENPALRNQAGRELIPWSEESPNLDQPKRPEPTHKTDVALESETQIAGEKAVSAEANETKENPALRIRPGKYLPWLEESDWPKRSEPIDKTHVAFKSESLTTAEKPITTEKSAIAEKPVPQDRPAPPYVPAPAPEISTHPERSKRSKPAPKPEIVEPSMPQDRPALPYVLAPAPEISTHPEHSKRSKPAPKPESVEPAKKERIRWGRLVRRTIWLGLAAAGIFALFYGHAELSVPGSFNVLPIENADVRASVDGVVGKIYVHEGDRVRAGQPIAQLVDIDTLAALDKTEQQIAQTQANLKKLVVGPTEAEIEVARAAVAKAKDALKYAQIRLNMMKQGLDQKLISQKEYEDAAALESAARNDLITSESQLRVLLEGSRPEDIDATKEQINQLQTDRGHLQKQRRLLTVYSPSAGIVATPTLQLKQLQNQFIKKGDLIAKVFDLRTVTAEITVDEKDIADVKENQRVVLRVRAFPNEEFFGKVNFVSISMLGNESGKGGEASPLPLPAPSSPANAKRTIIVTTQIENPSLLLKPEMTGQAKIRCGRRRALDLVTRRVTHAIKVEFWSWW